MKPAISQLRAWQPPVLTSAGTGLDACVDILDARMAAITSSVDHAMNGWKGNAADAAQARTDLEKTAANHLATTLISIVDALEQGAAALGTAKDNVLHLVTVAESQHMTLTDDGTVLPPPRPAGVTLPLNVALRYATIEAEAEMFTAAIHAGLDAVDAADKALAASLSGLIGTLTAAEHGNQATDAAVAPYLSGRALPTDPAALNALWETFSPADKDALFAKDLNLGNRDGIPVADRDHFNRLHLAQMRTDANNRLDALYAKHPDWRDHPPSSLLQYDPVTHADVDQYRFLHTQAAGYDAVAGQIDGRTDRFLMHIDGNGKGAIAINNPDLAPNVTTYVPGTGTQLPKISGDMRRAETMLDEARFDGAPANSSVIAWYGYNAPQTILPDAAEKHFADAAAPALDSFQDGLRASHGGTPSYNVVLGHSYGTTVVGDAASNGHTLDADQVVLLASPGTTVDRADQLSLTGVPSDQVGQHIWSTKAEHDPVPLAAHTHQLVPKAVETLGAVVGGGPGAAVGRTFGDGLAFVDQLHSGHSTGPFGVDPTDHSFGGRTFTSDPGPKGPLYMFGYNPGVHSDYWDGTPGVDASTSLHNMGLLMAGRTQAVTTK